MFLRRDQAEFVIEHLPGETLVYDLKRHKGHCLKEAAALVWEHCDGKTSVGELAAVLRRELHVDADEKLVWAVLRLLDRARLFQEVPVSSRRTPPLSRRELGKRLVRYGLPAALVLSITAPTPVQAATVFRCCNDQSDCPPGTSCTGPGAGHPCTGCPFKCCSSL